MLGLLAMILVTVHSEIESMRAYRLSEITYY